MHAHAKTANGCRPAQLLGPWLMAPDSFDALYDQVAMVINAGQYEVVARQSKEMAEAEAAAPPYTVENGVARFAINGPTTRTPTSMQAITGGTATLPLQRALRLAASDGFVSGGFVEVNSPGGTVDGMEELCAELARFRSVKPLRMHIAHQGTSAAMRASLEADAVTVDPMGIVGSVGTLTQMRDTSKLMERAGVQMHYIASGDRKAAGAPGTVVTPEQIAERQSLVDAINKNFLSAVERRRPQTKQHLADIARAGLYDAAKGVEIGLCDGVMTTDDALEQFTQRIPFGSGRTLP